MKYVYIVIVLACTVLVALFASQNAAPVTISFFSASVSVSLSFALILALAIGLLAGVLITLPAVIGGRFKNSLAKRTIKRLRKQGAHKDGVESPPASPASPADAGHKAEGDSGSQAKA